MVSLAASPTEGDSGVKLTVRPRHFQFPHGPRHGHGFMAPVSPTASYPIGVVDLPLVATTLVDATVVVPAGFNLLVIFPDNWVRPCGNPYPLNTP